MGIDISSERLRYTISYVAMNNLLFCIIWIRIEVLNRIKLDRRQIIRIG